MKIISVGFAILTALVLMSAPPVLAFQVAAMNLEQISTRASRIIVGTCTGKEEKVSSEDNLVYTEYTFSVSEVIKGDVGPTLIVRQAHLGRKPKARDSGHRHDASPDALGDRLHPPEPDPASEDLVPMPEYHVGQEVMLFLTGESKLGFSSPITLEQAVFDIQEEPEAEPHPPDSPTRGARKQIMSRVGDGLLFTDMSAREMAASRKFSASELSVFPDDTETPESTGKDAKHKRKKGVFAYEDFVSVVKKLSDGHTDHPKGGRK